MSRKRVREHSCEDEMSSKLDDAGDAKNGTEVISTENTNIAPIPVSAHYVLRILHVRD